MITFFSDSAYDSMRNKFSSREKKLLPAIGLLLLILLILWVVYAPDHGILALYRSQQQLEELAAENRRLTDENKTLQEEIDRLQHDPGYLEEKARKDYGMLKENEVLYIFKKK